MEPHRQRIAIVTPGLHRRGGTERVLVEELTRWTERFDIRVFAQDVMDEGMARGSLIRVPACPGPHLLRYLWWFAANRLWRWADRTRPDATMSPGINCLDADLIGIHMVFSSYWEQVGDRLARDLWSIPTFPRALHRTAFVNLIRALEQHVYSGPALLWTASRADARMVESRFGRPPGSVAAVPHGVDAEAFHPARRAERRAVARRMLGVQEGESLVLLVGNDLAKKGVDAAVSAIAKLPQHVRLAVAGRVPEGEVRLLAERAGVADRMLVLPHVDDPLLYYAAADVLVAPSKEDAFHLPALEAMACGLPVVVSARAGVAELLTPDHDAVVLEDPTDADAIVAGIERVLGDARFAEELSTNGRALAELNSWRSNAERTGDLIERELRTPRILVLATDPAAVGGIQRATRVLLRALCDLYGDDRVGTVALRQGGDASVPGRLLRQGRTVRAKRVDLVERARYVVSSMATARRWRRRLVVVAGHPHLAPVAFAAARLARAPFVVCCHGEEVWQPLRWSVAAAMRRADAILAPSRFTADQVARWSGLRHPPIVIAHPMPPAMAKDRAIARRSGRVLTVARLDPEHAYKGVDTLLTAWSRVSAVFPGAHLVVVGDGEDRLRLQALVQDRKLTGVTFAGGVSDEQLRELYATASVFALPASTRVGPAAGGEGFGFVFVEAAAWGLPVVAGKGGAIPEVVSDGETGILVDPADPADVASALIELLADPQRAADMGSRARERALERFSFADYRNQIGDLVRDLRPLPSLDDLDA